MIENIALIAGWAIAGALFACLLFAGGRMVEQDARDREMESDLRRADELIGRLKERNAEAESRAEANWKALQKAKGAKVSTRKVRRDR